MAAIEFKEGEVVLARHVPSEFAWKDGLSFFSTDPEYVQVGTWGYSAGKTLLAHTHNELKREVMWTQEVLYIRRGKIRADIYNTQNQKIAEVIASEGDLLMLLRGGHGYQILEDGTQVLEIKNGPYMGAELDRKRF